jgi:CubicO group peptidase (beta-lactamase class C family)
MHTNMRRAALRSLAISALVLLAARVGAQTASPESVGLSSERLHRIDELVQRSIDAGEISGAVTLVARNGKIARLSAQGVMGRAPGEGYGLGVRVVTDPVARGTWLTEGSFGWSGAYGTHFWADPKKNLTAILMAQTSSRTLLADFENAVLQAVVE